MQERQVTIAKVCFQLPFPFVVMATQNPIEQEGTYRLPEAQLDRFMFKIELSYNSPQEELEILQRSEKKREIQIQRVVDQEELQKAKEQVESIHVEKALKEYIVQIIQSTRDHPDTMFGSSPRGGIDLLKASKGVAFKNGRNYVTPKDILDIVKPILRHRVILSYEARAEGKSSDIILDSIIKEVPIP